MALTEKMKDFCKEYINNGYNATRAYLTAYNGNSEKAAAIESSKFLQRDDITEYIQALLKPSYNKALSEREKKRNILWTEIEHARTQQDHAAVARYMDILNKMDSEYININRNIEDNNQITDIDSQALLKIVNS